MSERTFVGLDVHARSVVACSIDAVTGEVTRARLAPDHEGIGRWIAGLEGPVAVTYEAGPTGFGLARFLSEGGTRCVVAAPSKIRRAPGDRVKTDTRDAELLARLDYEVPTVYDFSDARMFPYESWMTIAFGNGLVSRSVAGKYSPTPLMRDYLIKRKAQVADSMTAFPTHRASLINRQEAAVETRDTMIIDGKEQSVKRRRRK